MTAVSLSTEGRCYHIERTDIEGVRYLQITIINNEKQMVSRDHFTLDEGRGLAANVILELET